MCNFAVEQKIKFEQEFKLKFMKEKRKPKVDNKIGKEREEGEIRKLEM